MMPEVHLKLVADWRGPVTLGDVAAVLGCSKPAASMLHNHKYDRPNSDLPARYQALMRLLDAVRRDADADVDRICMTCDFDDCKGCRIAHLSEDR